MERLQWCCCVDRQLWLPAKGWLRLVWPWMRRNPFFLSQVLELGVEGTQGVLGAALLGGGGGAGGQRLLLLTSEELRVYEL